MECQYRSANGRLVFKLEGGIKELFGKIAELQDVFEADDKCGCCGSKNIRFRVRKAIVKATKKEARYHELRCLDCWAQFSFGEYQAPRDGLFPKRRENGKEIGNGGWYKYNGSNGSQEQDDADQWPA